MKIAKYLSLSSVICLMGIVCTYGNIHEAAKKGSYVNKNGWKALHYVAKHCTNVSILKYLKEKGVDLNEKTRKGASRIGIAIKSALFKNRSIWVTHLTLQYGFPLSRESMIIIKCNPDLNGAIKSNNKNVVSFYLDNGVDLATKSESGWTPLHKAAMYFEKCNFYFINSLFESFFTKYFSLVDKMKYVSYFNVIAIIDPFVEVVLML